MFQKLDELGQTLVIGRRTNVYRDNNESLYLPNDVTTLAREKGKLFVVGGIDYFFVANNKFPWKHIPDLVIARNGYDNFVVITAIENNVSVVDATSTLLAVHQTDADGNFAGTHAMRGNGVNTLLISQLITTRVGFTIRLGKYLRRGYVDRSPYITTNISKDGAVIVTVIKRPPIIRKKRKSKRYKLYDNYTVSQTKNTTQ